MTANLMHRILIAALLWLTLVFPTCAESTVFSVTPKNLDGGGQFVFAVTNSLGSNGLAFHVTITSKTGEVPANSEAHLCSATIKTNSRSIGPLTPETRVALKRSHHTSNADFVASNQILSHADASFVFTVWDPRGPAADFYVLKLRDFSGDQRLEAYLATLHVGMTPEEAERQLKLWGCVPVGSINQAMRHQQSYIFLPSVATVTLQYDDHGRLISWNGAQGQTSPAATEGGR